MIMKRLGLTSFISFALLALTFLCATCTPANAAQVQLPGTSIPQFVDPLPLLTVQGGPMQTLIPGKNDTVELHMREFKADVMPSTFVPESGTYTGTTVWGYIAGPNAPATTQGTYIGPVFVTTRGTPTKVTYVNDLGNTSNSQLPFWKNALDQTIHWADPLNGQMNMCAHSISPGQPPLGDCALNYIGPIPAVPHLHGGEVPPVLDGGPNAWFLSEAPNTALYPNAKMHGNGFYSMDGNTAGNYAIYRYPNSQEAAPLWFHDHLLGGTRLNVYAGLAGAYIIEDPKNPPPADLGDPTKIIPLVLQDRMFDTNGELFFPSTGINPEHPFWIPEFVGDTNVVNGKVWPYLTVEPKRYRFLFINGANARTYEAFLQNPATGALGPAMWQIETDGGYLDRPVMIDPNAPAGQLQKLLIMPGERAGVVIDFTGIAPGTTIVMQNTGNTPFPGGAPPQGTPLGQIIQFRVVASGAPVPATTFVPTATANLRPANPIVRLPGAPGGSAIVTAAGPTRNVQKVRELTLNEVMGAGGPLEILLNNTKWNGKSSDTATFPDGVRPDFTPVTIGGNNGGISLTEYYSELPNEGDTEVWELVNLTADAHPIHIHLVQFQLLNRQGFDIVNYNAAYGAAFPGGAFIPGYGPPLNYATGNTRALGGNPDVTPFLMGNPTPPDSNESGWKDTIHALPNTVTRFVTRFAPMDRPVTVKKKRHKKDALSFPFDPRALGYGFVWHCHILDHEDNEMMRPYQVQPMARAKRSYIQGKDY